MRRVMITGGPGAGKSTLAVLLGRVTGLPVVHMDHIHWKSGWIERDRARKTQLTHEVHQRELWILEGGHSTSYPERLSRADTFIWLDFPLWLRLWRVLSRSVRYHGTNRPDLPEGCPERLSMETIEFVRFIWRTRKTARRKLEKIYNNPPGHLQVVKLNNLRQVNGYLQSIATLPNHKKPASGSTLT